MSSQNTVENKANRNSIDMLHGPLVGKLFLFAIPLAFSSIFQQLFNSTDAIVAGRLLGSTELAAIGGVAPLTALFISFFVGVSIGTNATIAIRIGQGDRSKIRAAVHTTAAVSYTHLHRDGSFHALSYAECRDRARRSVQLCRLGRHDVHLHRRREDDVRDG